MLDVSDLSVPEPWRWFPESRYGLFIHWGPYAAYGRGEQVLARENIDHREYARVACAWNPRYHDAAAWADIVRRAGMKYAVLTTRHHDGYCLWDTAYTDSSSAQQAPKREFLPPVGFIARLLVIRIKAYRGNFNRTNRTQFGCLEIAVHTIHFSLDGMRLKIISADKVATAGACLTTDAHVDIHLHPKCRKCTHSLYLSRPVLSRSLCRAGQSGP